MNPASTRARSYWFNYVFRRHPVAAFLVTLALIIVTHPLDQEFRGGDLLEAALLTLLMGWGLVAMGGRGKNLFLGFVLVGPALVGKCLFHFSPNYIPAWTFQLPTLLFLMLMIVQLLKFILGARQVDSEVLCAGLAGYLLVGFLWSFAYMITAQFGSEAFSLHGAPLPASGMRGFTAIYFSFITLCTIGYGDIAPVSGFARMLAMSEAVSGTFYMAVMISRLVWLYRSKAPESQPPNLQ